MQKNYYFARNICNFGNKSVIYICVYEKKVVILQRKTAKHQYIGVRGRTAPPSLTRCKTVRKK